MAAPGHGVDRIVVTLLRDCEVYAAPTSRDEMLVAVLGSKEGLRREGESVRDAYARHVGEAHPELSVDGAHVHGAGPFWVRPSQVAGGRVFLLGDAAGFLDPLTGDGMSDALLAARKLAGLLAERHPDPAGAYRAWERGQWRRRQFVSRLALTVTGSSTLAARALRRMQQRPSTLDRLLDVNDGSRSLWSLTPRDWAALAGV
jgi:flavin-dependent dehydrogenase